MRLTVVAVALVAVVVASAVGNVSATDAEFNAAFDAMWDQADYKEVHPLIGRMAVQMMSPKNRAAAQKLVKDIPAEAGWADRLVFTEPKQLWVSPMHFINLPDGACKYNRASDCKGKNGEPNVCVDGAIQNYTARLANPGLPTEQRAEALKFLVHFIGDLHNPLHVANSGDWGGNKITGQFMAEPASNLHSIWDAALVRHRVKTAHGGSVSAFVTAILGRIQSKTGTYRAEANSWIKCRNARASYGACSDEWANESARLACDYAYVNTDGKTKLAVGFTLDDKYFQRVIPVIEKQIAKAAVRLARVLNMILDKTVVKPGKAQATQQQQLKPASAPIKKL